MLELVYQKRFLKDLAVIPASKRKDIERFVFDILPTLNNVQELTRFEKMTGYTNYYKARFGDYRVGALIEGNKVDLKRVLHRREIYRYFP